MNTVDDLAKQILAGLVDDFRAKNLGTSALNKEYVGPSIAELGEKYCADGPYSKVDFDLALKQLEESKLVKTGPMVPYKNTPGSSLVIAVLFSKREFVYLTEKGYKVAQKFPANPRAPAPRVQEHGSGDADRKFARLAIDEARKSVPEPDGRSHPKVGAVVVKNGKLLSTAYRGERPENHAEYIALEKKLADEAVAGATVYTTLEPCTTRNHPKIPCADRLIERKVARVVIGMLDPDDRISGKGQRKLRRAGIETALFPHDLAMEVEELNREFTRFCEQHTRNVSLPTTGEDQSTWPDVILECQWPSIFGEPKMAGFHTVRRRPWMLRNGGPGAVYNVRIRDIDFGDYQAKFPNPVRTLTDTAEVLPIICRKLEGQRYEASVVSSHDLESLIRNPPSGCDVRKYAIEIDDIDGAEDEEDEEIESDDSVLEVEIPVTVSYDDKNGARFKIKYLLHYEACIEKGEMIRIGRIEKVAPK